MITGRPCYYFVTHNCNCTSLIYLCLQWFYFISYRGWESVYTCGIHHKDNDVNSVFGGWGCYKTRTISTKLLWRIKLKKDQRNPDKKFIKETSWLDDVAVYQIFFMKVITNTSILPILFDNMWMSILIYERQFCHSIIKTLFLVTTEQINAKSMMSKWHMHSLSKYKIILFV